MKLKQFITALLTAFVLSVTIVPIAYSFLDLIGQYFADTSDLTNLLLFAGPALAAAFFGSFIAGWLAETRALKLGLLTLALYIGLDGLMRLIRFGRVLKPSVIWFTIWKVNYSYWVLLAIAIGILGGFYVGVRARRESHYIRLYVFAALAAILFAAPPLMHGLRIYNSFSAMTRGLL